MLKKNSKRVKIKKVSTKDKIRHLKAKCTKRHLVVDDSEMNLLIMQSYLKQLGLECDVAAGGVECIELLEEKKNPFYYDAVWTDLTMPDMSGQELVLQLRKKGFTMVIIAISGSSLNEKQLRKAKIDFMCVKPLKKNTLLDMEIIKVYQ